jgi:SAM-dependent methyltransferase
VTRRPESFNEVAALYDRARPGYPRELVEDLFRLTGLRRGDRVLEIGCGTGQMTLPLARRGVELVALEPGDALASLARKKLACYPTVQVIESTFEAYPLPETPFDLVISATAFHWIDPAIRVVQAARALRRGGHLAVVETHWGAGPERDSFSVRSQECYLRWDPEARPGFLPPTRDELPSTRPELEEAPAFEAVQRHLYEQVNRYCSHDYLDLLRTFSNVRGLDDHAQTGLLTCLGELIDRDFAGTITRTDTRELWLARRRGAA